MSTPPASPTLRARYDRRRAEVVGAAARVFARRGFHATSMQDLIEATGLTSGGLYHYIAGKDELLVAICDELMEPLLEQVREIVATGADAQAQLRELLHLWLSHVDSHRAHMLVFQQERHVLERGAQWKRVRRQRKEFEQLLAGILERAEREGRLHFRDRGLALRALLGMVNHTPQWFSPGGRLTTREVADGYLELLLAPHADDPSVELRGLPGGTAAPARSLTRRDRSASR